MRPIPIAELAAALYGPSSKYRGMALLKAYFDESGTHAGSPIVLIAGLIAPIETWIDIEREWNENLATSRVPYFHAYECDAGVGAFANTERVFRDALRIGLAKVIAKYSPEPVIAGIEKEDWERLQPIVARSALRESYGHPCAWCFEYCMQQVVTWSYEQADGEPVAIILASQDEYKTLANDIYAAHLVSPAHDYPLAFAAAKLTPAIQAADFVAYEAYKNFVRQKNNPNAPYRPQFEILLNAGKGTRWAEREGYQFMLPCVLGK